MIDGRLTAALSNRYLIERELGAGGMATVHLAEDLKHHRQVAIKVLHAELSALLGPERFLKEIELTASLQHPHILPLFDSGSADGLLYYVMPFVDGETLRGRLEREKQLPVADAVRIATEIADALQYAHGRGVVHRDVKPENVLLQNGHALVADFGIALAVQHAGGQRMTQTGLSLGTPQYMSPEQAMGEREIGPRSDIYSLGAVTYEMLVGEPPFTGPSAQAIVAKVMTAEPAPLAEQRKSVPPHVDAAVRTALEKLPADRFENSKAFADALANPGLAAGRAGPSVWAPRSRSRVVALLAAALVVTVPLAAWGWLRPTTAPTPSVAWRIPIELPDSGSPSGLSISRDGSTIVYSADRQGVRQLYRLTASTGRAQPVAGVPGGRISPDGRRVAYRNGDGNIVVQSLDGGSATTVAGGIGGNIDHWLDDDHLLVQDRDGLLGIPTDGGPPVRLIRRDSSAIYDNAAPLPPGDGILFNIFSYGGSIGDDSLRAGIAAVNLHGGKPVRLTDGRIARFAPPNHLIVNRPNNGSIVAFPFDPKHLRITGSAVPIVTGLPIGGYSNVGLFDVSASGRLIYLEGDDSRQADQLVRVDRGGAATPIGTLPGRVGSAVAIAPDGSRIAVIFTTPLAWEIEVRDVATGAVSRINSTAQFQSLAWAPDSRSLFYVAVTSSNTTIYRAVPGTVGAPTTILRTPLDSAVGDPRPSADGQVLYFSQRSARGKEIRSIALAGRGAARAVATAPAQSPAPSPDGRWLAYLALDQRGASTLVVRSTDTTRSEVWPVATPVTSAPRWSHDSKALYFVARDSMRVATLTAGTDFRVASEQALFPSRNLEPFFDVAPDGRFVMARPLPGSTPALHLVMIENWAAAR